MSFNRFGTSETGVLFSPTGFKQVTFGAPQYGALSDGRLWLNLFYQRDWGNEHVLIDELRTTRGWTVRTIGGAADAGLLATMMAAADENGYPTALPPGAHRAQTFILWEQSPEAAAAIGGRYRVDWEGSGTIQIIGGTNIVYSTNHAEFDYTPTGTNFVDISIMSTAGGGNHIKNMRCYLLRHASRLNAGYVVHPAFRSAWGTVKLLRWMQAQETNDQGVVNWADRPTTTSVGRGMCIEHMVDVCNELGMDGWWCFPHLADQTYVESLGVLIRGRMNPALKVYAEHTNEWWNSASGYVGAPYYSALAAGQTYSMQEVAGAHSARAMGWWSNAWSGAMSRTVRVAGVQTDWLGRETGYLLAPNYIAQHGGVVPHTVHDAIAVTGYYFVQGTPVWEQAITAAETDYAAGLAILVESADDYINDNASTRYPHFRTVANTYGKQLIMYEGGTHVAVPGGLSNMALARQLCEDINTGPEGYTLHAKTMQAWDAVGDSPFNHYVACQEFSINGSFGAQHYINDFSQPRYQALQEYNSGALFSVSAAVSGVGAMAWAGVGAVTVSTTSAGTPVGGQTLDMFYGLNSLHDHAGAESSANTRVGNWLARLSAQAPTPNTVTLGYDFGFADFWRVPPRMGGAVREEIFSPYIGFSQSWTNASQVEVVGMVPDNFFGFLVDPAAANSNGWVYETEILQWIDAWETNAPNANRRYVWYIGTPQLREPGQTYVFDQAPEILHTEAGYTAWYAALVTYQAWCDLVYTRITAARPALNIRKHSVAKAVMAVHQNYAPVRSIPVGDLFIDRAPHGTTNWYFLLAIAEYMFLFGEKPVASLTFNPAWNIHANISSNYNTIVDLIWAEVQS